MLAALAKNCKVDKRLLLVWMLTHAMLATGGEYPPSIAALLTPEVLKKVTKERQVVCSAALKDLPDEKLHMQGFQNYHFHTVMSVHASRRRAYQALTDYDQYQKLVPYIDYSRFDWAKKVLDLKGSIWKFELQSKLKFQEISERVLAYDIVDGHFSGLKGALLFDPVAPGSEETFVYFFGDLTGKSWPPKLIVERGAEVVFQLTGQKMRALIESKEEVKSQLGKP